MIVPVPIPHIGPADAPARRRRTPPLRAIGAAIALSIATVLGTSIAVGRQAVPISDVDPGLLVPILPSPGARGDATSRVQPSAAAVDLDPVGDFAVRGRSFEPRPQPAVDQQVGVIVIPPPTPKPTPRPPATRQAASTGNRVSGEASWFCQSGSSACTAGYPGGMYAAAGPALRVGNWRGRTVNVCAGGRCVNVKLIDWCQCYGTRVIDLYSDAFRRLGPLGEGTITVTVRW